VHSETVIEHFPGGLKIREYRNHMNGVYRKEEINAKGDIFHVIYDNPAEYRREWRMFDDGSWSQTHSFYNSDGEIGGTLYEYEKKNNADTILPGEYVNYNVEVYQRGDGPRERKETTVYYTGEFRQTESWTSDASWLGVRVSQSERTEFPDGREVQGETHWWNARYEWRDYPNVEVPPPPPDNDDLYGPTLENIGNAFIERWRDLLGLRKSGVIALENGTVSFSIEAHFGTSGNDQIQGTGFL